MRAELNVRLFGRLKIQDETRELREEQIRSEMITKLLAYLILHRGEPRSVQELAQFLWPNEESDNPAGALKNLVYRLRKALNQVWPELDFIITGKARYQWNPDIVLRIDAEELDRCVEQAHESTDAELKTALLERAFKIYEGRFLENFGGEPFFAQLQSQYHEIYLALTRELSELLEARGSFTRLEEIAAAAVAMDPLDDRLHACLLKAYIVQNEVKKAEEHYRSTAKLFYDRLGVNPSQELTQIYDRLMVQEHKQESDLSIIQHDLEEQEVEGAFYCEYGVFKKVYELEARRERRLGLSIFLSLITLEMEPGAGRRRGNYFEMMSDAMDRMQETIIGYLRSGDVVTRYSNNQFLVMLPGCNYENAKRVMKRLNDAFAAKGRRGKVLVQYSLKEMSLSS